MYASPDVRVTYSSRSMLVSVPFRHGCRLRWVYRRIPRERNGNEGCFSEASAVEACSDISIFQELRHSTNQTYSILKPPCRLARPRAEADSDYAIGQVMLLFARKSGQPSFCLARKLYEIEPKKGTIPEKVNSPA